MSIAALPSRRTLIAAAAGALASPVLAKAPLVGAQVTPLYRFKAGGAEITAISDGYLDIGLDAFPKARANPEVAAQLLAAQRLPNAAVRSVVNAYLVNIGDHLILVDAGGPKSFTPTIGELPRNLIAAGVDPATIDAVLLTHMHGDHVGALLKADGTPAFPNAELVIAAAEHRFWNDTAIMNGAPAWAQPFFKMAQDFTQPYAGKTRLFDRDGEVLKGIFAIATPGHTPGHTVYRVGSGKDALLITGDLVHVGAFQFARPDWSISFDSDPDNAVKARMRVFDMAATDDLLISGMHLAFPGVGYVERSGSAFAFAPKAWAPAL